MATTPITDLLTPIRILIGDDDPDIPMIEDARLVAAVELVLNSGEIEGFAVGDSDSVDPAFDLTDADDQGAYALLLWKTAKLFVQKLTSSSFRTRAFSESVGDAREHIFEVVQKVYDLENGSLTGE